MLKFDADKAFVPTWFETIKRQYNVRIIIYLLLYVHYLCHVHVKTSIRIYWSICVYVCNLIIYIFVHTR